MNKELVFEEKQYMGHNRLSMVVRYLLAMFCFIGYYWSENPKPVQVSIFRFNAAPMVQGCFTAPPSVAVRTGDDGWFQFITW